MLVKREEGHCLSRTEGCYYCVMLVREKRGIVCLEQKVVITVMLVREKRGIVCLEQKVVITV